MSKEPMRYRSIKGTEETTLSLLEKNFVVATVTGRVSMMVAAMTALLEMFRSLPEVAADPLVTKSLGELRYPPAPSSELFSGEREAELNRTLQDICHNAWEYYHCLKQRVGLGILENRGRIGDRSEVEVSGLRDENEEASV